MRVHNIRTVMAMRMPFKIFSFINSTEFEIKETKKEFYSFGCQAKMYTTFCYSNTPKDMLQYFIKYNRYTKLSE